MKYATHTFCTLDIYTYCYDKFTMKLHLRLIDHSGEEQTKVLLE